MLTVWDKRYIGMAELISTWTKDKSRGVGAVIVNGKNRVVSIGFNGFPTGIKDDIEERHLKPIKYKFTEHAERNAIYNTTSPLNGCKIYVTLFPCPDCARAIIQTGIVEVICPYINELDNWCDDFKISKEMFEEVSISVKNY